MNLERLEDRVKFLEEAIVDEKIMAGEAIAATIALAAFVLDRVDESGVVRRLETMRQLEIWAKSFEGTNPLASQMMRSLAISLERKGKAGLARRA